MWARIERQGTATLTLAPVRPSREAPAAQFPRAGVDRIPCGQRTTPQHAVRYARLSRTAIDSLAMHSLRSSAVPEGDVEPLPTFVAERVLGVGCLPARVLIPVGEGSPVNRSVP